ncbi:MAG: ABC transporter ATP-binding protein [Faecousia sp.]
MNSNLENKTLLEVKDLRVEYTSEGNTIKALNGVSFSLGKGRALGLVGETGAGKTTVFKSILRILPDISARIVGGEIIYEGTDLLSLSEKNMQKVRGNSISMIFQDPMTSLDPVMKIGKQISEVIHLHNPELSKKETEQRGKEMLEMVGIPASRYHEYPHQFSGGMKQRVVIAMALACKPQLLLADEPTSALDVTIQAQVLDLIRRLKEEQDTSLILVTHDLGVVAKICDDVAVVYAGRIVEIGSLEKIFRNPSHPYTQGLFNAIPDLKIETDRLAPIDGSPPDPTNLPMGCSFCPRCPYAEEACEKNSPELKEVEEGHFCLCMRK